MDDTRIQTPARPLADTPDEELNARETSLQAELSTLREQLALLNAQYNEYHTKLKEVRDELASRHLVRTAACPDWPYLLYEDGLESYLRHTAAAKAVGGLAKLGHHEGLSTSGYQSATNQRCLRVSLLRDAPGLTARVAEALQEILPHVKARPTDERGRGGYKYVSVAERTLSTHGSYSLAIDEDKSVFQLNIIRHGRASVVHAATSLLALLQYVERNHPYGSNDNFGRNEDE